jgi:hypothetical protein
VLSYRDDSGFWYAYAYDEAGRDLTYRNSGGYREDCTYDNDGKRTIKRTQEAA